MGLGRSAARQAGAQASLLSGHTRLAGDDPLPQPPDHPPGTRRAEFGVRFVIKCARTRRLNYEPDPEFRPTPNSCRNLTEHRAAPDHAALRGGVIGRRAVHHAAVVPDQELAGLPAVLVGEIRMDGERVQLLDQRAPGVIRHAENVFRVIAEIEAFAPGLGMRAHYRVIDWRLGEALRLGERILAVAP